MGVGLADHEIVDIEHLRQGAHGQVFLQAAVTPAPSPIIVLSLWLEPACPAASITSCDCSYIAVLTATTCWLLYVGQWSLCHQDVAREPAR